MNSWPVHEIAGDAEFRISREMPKVAPGLDAEISRIWDVAQKKSNGQLFNGQVFSADVISSHLVLGHWTEYRRIVAQIARPELHPVLGVRSLAVGGVIHGPDGIVFGRRPVDAVYQAGEWQLAPAGAVDPRAAGADGRIDVVHQLLTELREELGLPAEAVHSPRPLCIVEHDGSHVLDLGIAVETDLGAAAIRAAHTRDGNGEYDPLEIVPVPALPAFLSQAGTLLNGQAPAFLSRAGFL